MWAIIILLMISAVIIGFVFLISRIIKFSFIKNLSIGRVAKTLISTSILLLSFALFFIIGGFMNAMVIFLHFVIIWAISDFIANIYRKIKKCDRKKYISGAVAIIVTVIYLCYGIFSAFYVFRTEYNIKTNKNIGTDNLKIVGFSDSHIGVTLNHKDIEKCVEKINAEKPDIVVIVGDYIDDGTTLSELEKSSKALKKLTPRYGTYYVFGNHDAGYGKREYDRDDLVFNLRKNNVSVLEDDVVKITDKISLIGRKDRQSADRLMPNDFGIEKNNYNIVLDHQPYDFENLEKSGVDLVISGHTHGGQMIPINRVGRIIGENDMTYGHEKRSSTDFIVSSGISNWELYFKTGCISEYFVINLTSK